MEVGAKLLIFFADLRELGVEGAELGGDGHYTRDGGGQRTERMEPSPTVKIWSACGDRSWTRSGFSWRLSLVSLKISDRKARGGDGCVEGEGEGVMAREMAAAKA